MRKNASRRVSELEDQMRDMRDDLIDLVGYPEDDEDDDGDNPPEPEPQRSRR